jgi:7,8-dihydropterin-6-yl-methyl-4-(beta-D-ribofuranosyl)aminobenzene 5'-phosphate synthase
MKGLQGCAVDIGSSAMPAPDRLGVAAWWPVTRDAGRPEPGDELKGDLMHRRDFIKLSAVAGGLFAMGGMGLLRASAAHAARLAVPTVDRLVLTSAVDNIYDSVLPNVRFGSLDVRRRGVRDLLGPTPPAAEHGLALHLDSYQGDQRRQVLLDFSLTSRNLLNNYALLGIEPAEADALVLSHGHFDHWGGFLDLAEATPAWADQGKTLYAGGEDSFCKRWVLSPDGSRLDLGQLDRDAVEARGVSVMLRQGADDRGRPRHAHGPDPAPDRLRATPAVQ